MAGVFETGTSRLTPCQFIFSELADLTLSSVLVRNLDASPVKLRRNLADCRQNLICRRPQVALTISPEIRSRNDTATVDIIGGLGCRNPQSLFSR